MAAVSETRRVFLDDLAPRESFRNLTGGALMTVYPAPGREREVARRIVGTHPHFTCWRKSQIPRRFRYGKNPRVAPILCLPQTGWLLTTRDFKPAKPERGAHGFDPASPEMAAIFMAHGPAIRPGARLPTFDNVDIQPLLARLLGVDGGRVDGSLKIVGRALVDR
jgi:predicted AlkP superfamily pyrophosphatase or phosphodiesterase